MPTCLGEDAGIDFALDGTWQAHNRADGHTYRGEYRFTGTNGLALTAGHDQRYTLELSGNELTLIPGRTLRISLHGTGSPMQDAIETGEAMDGTVWQVETSR